MPDPAPLQLRPLTPEDAAPFAALRLRGLRECPEAFSSSYDEEAATPLSDFERRLQPQAGRAVLGALQGGTLIGTVGIKREDMRQLSHKAFLWGVYVAPEARQQGVGRALLRYALQYAADPLGVRQVNLGVTASNTAAVELYRALGFVTYGVERDYLCVDGRYHDEYQMACRVRAA
ncbi:GNAT family N-acetyltransferase [Paracidovorax valerianellae]|uniref:GNAT family N-acetyltransferase n=1 Tax=Paracidovorax valerianellae TaxID=187868 RepID=UPI0023039DD9|nr:GNAT family N-acetyltransferase [Paracidovorax valerianellae]MDA8443524.1 GNAT family N-acetyltransferase [Paracidovorax valerianellae]